MANKILQPSPLHHAFRQDQLYLVLYLDQEYDGPGKNQNEVVKPKSGKRFGATVVNDWPIYDGPDKAKAKMVARARGHHMQTAKNEHNECGSWFLSCNIVFLDDSCYPGSTLVVTGMIEQRRSKGEWAIVGGTGEFTLAQGAIYYDVLMDDGSTSLIKELHIGLFYTPMERSKLRVMFHEFNPSEIDNATDNGLYLGQGGFGSVYMAKIRNTVFAVKIQDYGSRQGKREFKQEVEILRSIRHKNLVTLVGACSKRLALVYEYLPNGTLEDRLNKLFSWEERVNVATSICTALEFLHNVKPNPIAHGDLKPSNILFDARDVCKLGDFGISRLLEYKSETATPSHTTVLGKGTRCYMDPEFIRTNRLTPYSDVYALGIILLQLVTGREIPTTLREDVRGVLGDVENKSEEDEQTETICEELVDARLKLDARSKLDAVEMLRLGLRCSNDAREERPKVIHVRREIESMKGGASQD